jgi:hypothetical protein
VCVCVCVCVTVASGEGRAVEVAGAFGAYCGYTLEQSSNATQECFQGLERTPAANRDPISVYLLGRESVVSRQLLGFCICSSTRLEEHPECFERGAG